MQHLKKKRQAETGNCSQENVTIIINTIITIINNTIMITASSITDYHHLLSLYTSGLALAGDQLNKASASNSPSLEPSLSALVELCSEAVHQNTTRVAMYYKV